jgi:hypothetical protein
MNDRKLTVDGKEYLSKDVISGCLGCAFRKRTTGFCSEVSCSGIIYIEDSTESIMHYLEAKLNYEKDGLIVELHEQLKTVKLLPKEEINGRY